MQFNPTSKENSIIADIDFLLFGDSSVLNTNYSLVDRTRNINLALDDIVAELHKADPNYQWDDQTNADFPVATLALTANQDHYTMLDSSLRVWRVRMKDSNGELKTLTPKLKSELTDSDLKATGSPDKYYKIGGAIFPTPIPDYGFAAGVELTFQRGANHFSSTDTNEEPGFNSMFHEFLPVSAALRYAKANNLSEKVSFLEAERNRIREAVRTHYERRSPDDRTRLRLRRDVKNYGIRTLREF